MKRLALLIIIASLAGPVFAVQPNEILADPRLEARARSIGKELRCLVCQNESIDDSNADLAHDLRIIVRQRLSAGDTDEQVRQYIVRRYGEYVLLKPPIEKRTLVLWFGPIALLLCGLFGLVAVFRRGSKATSSSLSAAERAHLNEILQKHPAAEKDETR